MTARTYNVSEIVPGERVFEAALQEVADGFAPGTEIHLERLVIEIPAEAGAADVATAIREALARQGTTGEAES
jgi:hypothetical protein